MNKSTMVNNLVDQKTLREIQLRVLNDLSDKLRNSFGPMGSNTCIKKENAYNIYTKDGHTILKSIIYHGIIEQSIKDDIETITRHIVKTVGDGTTSAVMLSYEILQAIDEIIEAAEEDNAQIAHKAMIDATNDLVERIQKNEIYNTEKYTNWSDNLIEEIVTPVEITKALDKVIGMVTKKIKEFSKDCTLEDIYDICMISTNGNEFISSSIRDIYRDYGMEVFIDVAASIDEATMVKAYDGMTINTGFNDPCYITDTAKNESVIDNPRIYFFEHPIDTKEMAVLLDAILSKNIVTPYNEAAKTGDMSNIIPTVIIAPKISQDLSSLMASIINLMGQLPAGQKLPLLIISGYHQVEEIQDIAKMCDGPFIHKYIDADILEEDIKNGQAPTPDTIQDFCGFCNQVVASPSKTSFIRPISMRDESGEYSLTYKNLLSYLEVALSQAKESGEDAHVIGTLKRRIHALKSNLVEFIIGGISQSDRDALRDLVEDAVLNCRSAAANGVGYGANFMALKAIKAVDESIDEMSTLEVDILCAINNAYRAITEDLYSKIFRDTRVVPDYCLLNDCPFNIRTKEFDGKVKSSIESDIIVLDTVGKIIGLMATCNQFMVPTAMHNVYTDIDE